MRLLGGGGQRVHESWDPGGGDLAAGLGVEHLILEGVGGAWSRWTSRLSRAGAKQSWGTGLRGPKGIGLGLA